MNDDLNLICKNFQDNLVNVFNNENNLPFILKYYLMQQVWQTVKQKKQENDYLLMSTKTEQRELVTEVPVPEDFLATEENDDANKDKEDQTK